MADEDDYDWDRPNEIACQDLIDALQRRNRSDAAASLRQIEDLPPHLRDLLADLIDEAVPPTPLFPWKLKFTGKRGKPPPHILDQKAEKFGLAMSVRDALVVANGKKEAAFQQVQEDILKATGKKISLTKIKDAYYKYR